MNCVVIYKVGGDVEVHYYPYNVDETIMIVDSYMHLDDFIVVEVLGVYSDWSPYKELFINKYKDQLI